MKRTYAAAIETGDSHHAWGIAFPDLPGCFSAADTADEILPMARQALLLHLETALEEGAAIPPSASVSRLSALRADPAWKAFQEFILVDVDLPEARSVRINITLPETVLSKLDAYTKRTGQSRSAVLAQAASRHVAVAETPPSTAGNQNHRGRKVRIRA